MDVTLAWRMIRKWWWVLIAATAVGGALGYGLSLQVAPTYEATTTLLVTQRQTEGVVQLNDIQTAERMANTFSRLVTLRPVLEQAIADGALPFSIADLDAAIAVNNPTGTQLLEVSARANDADIAARMANTVAAAFISSNEAERTSRPGTVSVVEDAIAPGYPVAPRPRLNAVLAAMLAIGAAGAVVLLVEYLDDTVKGPEQAQEITGLPTLGRIERFEGMRSP
ncbi:MAG: Wzz/FepE/Etk N-terminal domain-containing protein [Actinomycetota bacterium]|nr:Wzz/FepE/Etk N-terminal domain-containing protein [Actinomycetota bacterium]